MKYNLYVLLSICAFVILTTGCAAETARAKRNPDWPSKAEALDPNKYFEQQVPIEVHKTCVRVRASRVDRVLVFKEGFTNTGQLGHDRGKFRGYQAAFAIDYVLYYDASEMEQLEKLEPQIRAAILRGTDEAANVFRRYIGIDDWKAMRRFPMGERYDLDAKSSWEAVAGNIFRFAAEPMVRAEVGKVFPAEKIRSFYAKVRWKDEHDLSEDEKGQIGLVPVAIEYQFIYDIDPERVVRKEYALRVPIVFKASTQGTEAGFREMTFRVTQAQFDKDFMKREFPDGIPVFRDGYMVLLWGGGVDEALYTAVNADINARQEIVGIVREAYLKHFSRGGMPILEDLEFMLTDNSTHHQKHMAMQREIREAICKRYGGSFVKAASVGVSDTLIGDAVLTENSYCRQYWYSRARMPADLLEMACYKDE